MTTIEKTSINLEEVKKEITQHVGKRITIQERNRVGKKVKECSGVIISAYDSLFIVRIQIRENYLNKSFSYVDFLTNEMFFQILDWVWKNFTCVDFCDILLMNENGIY